LLGGDDEKQSETTEASKIIHNYELMDITQSQNIAEVSQNNGMNLDLLGGSSSNQQSDLNTIMSQMLSMNLGLGQPSSVI
jgi:hypothetical protein